MTSPTVSPPSSMGIRGIRIPPAVQRLRETAPPWAGFAARIIAGMLWLSNTDWKRPPDFGRPNRGLWIFANHGITNQVFGPFRWVLEEIVVPNFKAFGWITIATEVLLAALLLSGAFTRFAALLGIGQAIAITLSVLNTPGEYNWAYYMMIALHLAILANGAGPWSVDSMIAKARAGNMTAVIRAVNAGRVGLLVVLGGVGAFLVYEQRDKSFSVSKKGVDYFQYVGTNNQAVRGTVLLGVTLIGLGLLVAAIGRLARPARALGAFLILGAVICAATYGTSINVFGGAPSTSAILLVAAAFLLGASWAVSHVAVIGSRKRAA